MKKLLALVLALLLALSCAAFAEENLKESAKEAVEVPSDFSFRGVVGWNSTQEEIMVAFAEFGIAEDDLYIRSMPKEVKAALGDLTYLTASGLPVAGKKAGLEVLMWKGVPGMYVYDVYLQSDAEALCEGLALKYGESVDDKTQFVSMMGMFGFGADVVEEFAQWQDGDTLICYVKVADSLAYNVFYINRPYFETVVSDVTALVEGAAAAEAQAQFDAATAGL